MGFTVEDMMLVSKDHYRMKLIAGKNGWSNSISWLIMLEGITIIRNFAGKELAVTTGLGFPDEASWLELTGELVRHHASGLVVNTGFYIKDMPDSVLDFCNENDLPLLTVPWDVVLAEMIKDLSIRIFLQGTTDEQISAAFIAAIEHPQSEELYTGALLSNFDMDGTFQVVLLHQQGLDVMDTVERKRISYRIQLYLENITHNGHFFYYDSHFVLIINAVPLADVRDIVLRFQKNIKKRMPSNRFTVAIGSQLKDIRNLRISYLRAKAALARALDTGAPSAYFDEMGIYRLLYTNPDRKLLSQMSEELLQPLLEYDEKHNADYTETLEQYLKYDGSIQKAAEAMFTHRNTVLYRMNNIRNLLGCSLETQEEKLQYQIACLLRHVKTR